MTMPTEAELYERLSFILAQLYEQASDGPSLDAVTLKIYERADEACRRRCLAPMVDTSTGRKPYLKPIDVPGNDTPWDPFDDAICLCWEAGEKEGAAARCCACGEFRFALYCPACKQRVCLECEDAHRKVEAELAAQQETARLSTAHASSAGEDATRSGALEPGETTDGPHRKG
jgi:hypothetical protein